MAAIDPQAAQFVFFPNRYIHDSWRAGMLQEPVWALLAGCERTEGRLAAFVSEKAGLAVPAALSLDNPQARFCLLPATAILKVAQRTGLALNAARLGKLIDGKLVARLRRDLGAEAYEFALRRAPLITTQTDPLAPDLSGEAPIGAALERSGINYIGLALQGVAPELGARFRLKLPKDHAPLLETPQGDTAPEAAWQVVRKVVREAEPQWSASLE
ncbi:MAG TPA: SctK family type III secretion system sorting platform protein [Reyranella sp.]|nr:SctK family type III secretion system sorting platform protein [Reyranella sp.]